MTATGRAARSAAGTAASSASSSRFARRRRRTRAGGVSSGRCSAGAGWCRSTARPTTAPSDLTVAADRASVRTAPALAGGDRRPGGTRHAAPALHRDAASSPTRGRCSTNATAAPSSGRRSSAGSSPSASPCCSGVLPGAVTAAVGAEPATGSVATVAVLLVCYYTGGYVAGRLARFDGARNGFLSWVVGILATHRPHGDRRVRRRAVRRAQQGLAADPAGEHRRQVTVAGLILARRGRARHAGRRRARREGGRELPPPRRPRGRDALTHSDAL